MPSEKSACPRSLSSVGSQWAPITAGLGFCFHLSLPAGAGVPKAACRAVSWMPLPPVPTSGLHGSADAMFTALPVAPLSVGHRAGGEEGQTAGCLPLPSFFLPMLPLLLLMAPTHRSGTPSVYAHHAAALWDSLDVPGEPDSALSPAWDLRWLSVTPGCQAEVLASFGLLALGTSHSVPLWPLA